MADIFGRLDDLLCGLTGGLTLRTARQDWERTVRVFLSRQTLEEAGRLWEEAARKFYDSLEELLDSLTDDTTRAVLEGLLLLMKIKLGIDPGFRRNIQNFPKKTVKYLFATKSGAVNIPVEFADGTMRWPTSASPGQRIWARLWSWWGGVRKPSAPPADVTLEFANGRALLTYLFKYGVLKNRDLLGSLLNNDIHTVGNVNYLFKFAFLANHMLLEVTGEVP